MVNNIRVKLFSINKDSCHLLLTLGKVDDIKTSPTDIQWEFLNF